MKFASANLQKNNSIGRYALFKVLNQLPFLLFEHF
jgi:hypothetical protein